MKSRNSVRVKGITISLCWVVLCIGIAGIGIGERAEAADGASAITDHGGSDWIVGDGEVIGGVHINVGEFRVEPSTATVFIASYLPDKPYNTGFVDVYARDIRVSGTVDGSGRGYTGGGGGAGKAGPGIGARDGNPGNGSYGGFSGIGRQGHCGDGPYGGIGFAYGDGAPGGYDCLIGNCDDTTDFSVRMGSGGAGGYGGGGTFALPCWGGGGGGGAGGNGGGFVKLIATDSLTLGRGAEIRACGCSGDNGANGWDAYFSSLFACYGGSGGNGGSSYAGTCCQGARSSGGQGGGVFGYPPGESMPGYGGGDGAGGGILLACGKENGMVLDGAVLRATGGISGNGGTVKLFHSGSSSPRAGAIIDAERVYVSSLPFIANHSFLQGSEGWSSASVPGVFSEPVASGTFGKLNLQAADNTNTFGSWVSPSTGEPLMVDDIHYATFMVSSSVEDGEFAPAIRMRMNDERGQMSASLHVQSLGDGWYSPSQGGRFYTLLADKQLGEPVRMAIDIMNFFDDDEATATISLDEATLRKLDVRRLGHFTKIAEYTFQTSTEGWFSGDAAFMFTPAIASHGEGKLKLTARNNQDCFGFWTSPLIAVDSNRIYRVSMNVSTDCKGRQKVPQFRLRLLTVNIHAAYCLNIESSGAAESSPVAGESRSYWLYFIPPKSAEPDGMRLSIDILNFDPSDEAMGSIYLDYVNIETALNVLYSL